MKARTRPEQKDKILTSLDAAALTIELETYLADLKGNGLIDRPETPGVRKKWNCPFA